MVAAELDDLADDAFNAALELLETFRKELLGMILAAPQPFSASYRQLLREVDALLATLERGMAVSFTQYVELAANAGDEAALDQLRAMGLEVPLAYVGINPQLVRTASEYVSSLITQITNEARAAISREIRLAVLGGTSTVDLIDRIGRTLDTKGVFRTIRERAEAIARTEVSRVYNTAHWEQSTELAQRYDGLRQVWEHSSQAVGATAHQRRMARANHVAVARRTAKDPIPIDQEFDLGNGITARFPHDPRLPASEVVHCRCRRRLIAPEPKG